MNEKNGQAYANDVKPENSKAYAEYRQERGNASVPEFTEYKPESGSSSKKSTGFGKIFSLFSAAIVAVVGGITLVTSSGGGTVAHAAFETSDTEIYYFMEMQDMGEDDEVLLLVENRFTNREVPIEGENAEGVVEGLKPDMAYSVRVVNGNKTLFEEQVRTTKPRPQPVTMLNGVTHECTCQFDGLFRFQIDFIDETYDWSDFVATLTDGIVEISRKLLDPHAEQTIPIEGSELSGSEVTFEITCLSAQTGERVTIYKTTVQI